MISRISFIKIFVMLFSVVAITIISWNYVDNKSALILLHVYPLSLSAISLHRGHLQKRSKYFNGNEQVINALIDSWLTFTTTLFLNVFVIVLILSPNFKNSDFAIRWWVWLLMLPSAATLTILMIEIRKRKQNKEI